MHQNLFYRKLKIKNLLIKPHQLATNMILKDKIIFITGAAKGIGLELAKQLATKENVVIIGGRNQMELDKISHDFVGIKTILFDALNNMHITDAVENLMQNYGRLDILINNAAILHSGNFKEANYDFCKIENEILTNIAAPIKLTKLVLPLLEKNTPSAIVNITSGVAYLPMQSLPVYSATKSALQSFTISLRENLRHTNIRVFEALPPLVATQMTANMSNNAKDMKKISAKDCATAIIKGIENDNYTNNIGSSKSLYWGRRLFPNLVQKQLNKM
jgi:uncharacterized oxidoreductase